MQLDSREEDSKPVDWGGVDVGEDIVATGEIDRLNNWRRAFGAVASVYDVDREKRRDGLGEENGDRPCLEVDG